MSQGIKIYIYIKKSTGCEAQKNKALFNAEGTTVNKLRITNYLIHELVQAYHP